MWLVEHLLLVHGGEGLRTHDARLRTQRRKDAGHFKSTTVPCNIPAPIHPGHLFTVSTPPSLFVYSFLPAPSLVLLVSPLIFPSPSGPPPLISRLSCLLSSPLFSYSYICSRPNKSFIALLWIAKQYKWEVERANE